MTSIANPACTALDPCVEPPLAGCVGRSVLLAACALDYCGAPQQQSMVGLAVECTFEMNHPLRVGALSFSPLRCLRGLRRPTSPVLFAAATVVLAGCPKAQRTAVDTPHSEQIARNTDITHDDCDLSSSSAKQLAVDDKGPAIIIVMDGNHEACRAIDLNRDGAIDAFRYFDTNGRERRREGAFGRSGLPSEVSIFRAGVLVRKELETNADTRLDTWQYFEGGRLVREERDSTGDGYIDQWWTFNRPDMPDCAVVLSDENGDGKPEDSSRIDMCKDVQPPAPATKPSDSPAPDDNHTPTPSEDARQ